MTFDDGILTIYSVTNIAKPGDKPVVGLKEKESFYFAYDQLGIRRFYEAKNANQEISAVVNIPGWNDVETTDVCIIEGKEQYQIDMAQTMFDENGLRIMRLSLERIGQKYEVPGTG